MKKLTKLLFIIFAVCAVSSVATACGGGSKPQPTTTPSVGTSASVTPSVAPSVAHSVVPTVSPSVMPSVVPTVIPSASVTPSVGASPSVPSVTPSVPPTPSIDWATVFTVNGAGETITGLTAYGKTLSKIEIPETLNGVQITAIGDYAFRECASLTEIVIPNSVTSIDSYAFSHCHSLTTVTFGDNSQLTSIGGHAFEFCYSLTEIVIPDSVTSIGKDAFSGCEYLTIVNYLGTVDQWAQINFSDYYGSNPMVYAEVFQINGEEVTEITLTTATTISNYAFYGFDNITKATISASVTSIGGLAFYYCDSLTIYCEAASKPSGWNSEWNYYNIPVVWDCKNNEVAEDGAIYKIIDGIRYALKDGVATVVEQPRNIAGSITIPASVTYKGNTYAVTSIGDSAFYYCRSLTEILIPSSVTSIGSSAFFYCDSFTIYCEAASKPSGWDSDWSPSNLPVVWDCKNNEVAEDGAIYKTIDGIRYALKDGIATVVEQPRNIAGSITIPVSVAYNGTTYSVTSIGSDAFSDCASLTEIVIPDSVTSIGNGAFYGCYFLTTVNYLGTVDQWAQISFSDNASNPMCHAEVFQINGEEVTEITLTTATISNYAFYGFDNITKVTISASVTSIGSYAFFDCYSLTEIVIPDSVTSIGDYAISYCYSLTTVTFGENSQLASIGSEAFSNCYSLTEIVIPEGVASIASGAFEGCDSLTIYCEAASKPSGWDSDWSYSILPSEWNYSNLPVVWDCKNNDVAEDGAIYKIIDGIRYALKDGVATVVEQPRNITGSITIPASVTYKGNTYAVTSIGKDAFYYCASLTEIVIPNSVTSIGEEAFRYCDSLTKIVIPEGVTSIGSYAFRDCKSLTTVTFGANSQLTSIGTSAFLYCDSLTEIVIPSSVTSIGNYAFSWCSSLTEIVIPSSVTSIGGSAFYYCASLTIYCEAASEPSGWDSGWNYSNRPVVWGYTGE